MAVSEEARPPTKLAAWREERGWTLVEVSGLTGVSVGILNRAELGKFEFSAATRVLIARRLGAKVQDLFEVPELPEAVG